MNIILAVVLLATIIGVIITSILGFVDEKIMKSNKIAGFLVKGGVYAIIMAVLLTSTLTISSSAIVDGTSMNPTLEDGEYLNMSASVVLFNKVISREVSEFNVDDIIVFETNGFLGYDTLDAIDEIAQDSTDITNDIIVGDDLSHNTISNNTYIKRVQYIADVNGDGVDDYYVRGDNRDDSLASVDSKNFGFVDGTQVLGVVQDDMNPLLIYSLFAFIGTFLVIDGVVSKYLKAFLNK